MKLQVLAIFLTSVVFFVSGCSPTDSKTSEVKTLESASMNEPHNSTPEEMRYALNECIPSIRNTDECMDLFRQGFNAPILSTEFDYSLLAQLEICDSEYERIKSTRERHSEADIGEEALECLTITQLIVGYRAKGLWAVKAMSETNNEEELLLYREEAISSFEDANKLRTKFKADYGY